MKGRPIKKYLAEIERKLSAFKMEVRRFMRAHSMMTCVKRCEIVLLTIVTKMHSTCYTVRLGVRKRRAMGNSTLPTVLDKLCMVANINPRKLIEQIKDFRSRFILNYGQKKIGSEDSMSMDEVKYSG